MIAVILAVIGAVSWAVIASPLALGGVAEAAQAGGPLAVGPAASGPSTEPSTSGVNQCTVASISMGLTANRRVKLSVPQEFSLTLHNNGSAPCELVVSPSSFKLAITSGSDPIWSTTHCGAWLPSSTVTLAAGQSHKFVVTWPVVRSQANCKVAKTSLRAGTYVAWATWNVNGSISARQVMDVTA